MHIALFAAVAAAGAALVSAQSPLSISPQCQSALLGIVSSPDSACLNPSGILAIIATPQNTSLVTGINTWLGGFCGKEQCTNQTLAAIVTNFTTGCPAETAALGLKPDGLSDTVQAAFPTFRKVICLKDNRDSELCLTQTLKNIETAAGKLSLSGIIPAITRIILGQGNTTSVICTDCVKAAYTIIKQDRPGLLPTGIETILNGQCGASFSDGTMPSSITQTAVASTASTGTTSKGGAVRWTGGDALSMGLSVLSLVAGAFAFL